MSSELASRPLFPVSLRRFSGLQDADRVGVFASVLCAIHCVATPFLLLLLPTFGKLWAHPASHWGMALIVVPIAIFMMIKGFRQHGRAWIVAAGILGVFFILLGAAAPSFENGSGIQSSGAMPSSSDMSGCGTSSCGSVDACCPSVVTLEDGSKTLNVPAASVLTTLGGFFLIITHLGNIRQCSSHGCAGSKA